MGLGIGRLECTQTVVVTGPWSIISKRLCISKNARCGNSGRHSARAFFERCLVSNCGNQAACGNWYLLDAGERYAMRRCTQLALSTSEDVTK